MVSLEPTVLAKLNFDLVVFHPLRSSLGLLEDFNIEVSPSLKHSVSQWTVYSMYTNACFLHPPVLIGAATVVLALKGMQVEQAQKVVASLLAKYPGIHQVAKEIEESVYKGVAKIDMDVLKKAVKVVMKKKKRKKTTESKRKKQKMSK